MTNNWNKYAICVLILGLVSIGKVVYFSVIDNKPLRTSLTLYVANIGGYPVAPAKSD